ncbi:beta-glucosidase BglX [Alteromonas sediminis]|nr:beta-glucosidase BglX [Alteromonas sediminis]
MNEFETKALALLKDMTLEEKIGQMNQVSGSVGYIPEHLSTAIRAGRVGSVINEVDPDINAELQRIAKEETRLGIPLLIGRDVIHGFRTIFPIPLGQAATWCKDTIAQSARIAAIEANTVGVNWTFSPMIDIARDPRWGRIAESFGEDPYLCATLSVAMVEGYQSESLSNPTALAACAKHFAGYGASESGRDYNTTNIPENELRNVYLPPFHALSDAQVATFMTSFSDLNGIPASGNTWLTKTLLRDEWGFKGFVVSDWESIKGLTIHGLAEDKRHAAKLAATAQVDMEMVSECYLAYLGDLVENNEVPLATLDTMVSRILTLKFEMGLFDSPRASQPLPQTLPQAHLLAAKNAALKSCVLLKNQDKQLPLRPHNLNNIAVIGPLADDGFEQMGTWVFDGCAEDSVTVLSAIKARVGDDCHVSYQKAMANSRSQALLNEAEILQTAKDADVIVAVLGEEAILSGEAHCRTNIDLPGAQHALINVMSSSGKPVVAVIMAGRPLTLEPVLDKLDAVLYAWHPGTMGGPAIAELLFGVHSPSGKLPVSFPRVVGQIPLYYAQKQTGRPADEESFIHQDDIPERAGQTSLGMTATHLDCHFSALFPFGFGLSYADFHYSDIALSSGEVSKDAPLTVSVTLTNMSDIKADEIVQLYIRDRVGSVTRPVKELKGFQRVTMKPNESRSIHFLITVDDLRFYDINQAFNYEQGDFEVWVGSHSHSGLHGTFKLVE